MNITEFQLQCIGVAMVLYVAGAIGFGVLSGWLVTRDDQPVKGPVMELEFARTIKRVNDIAGNDADLAKSLRTAILFDTFGFVPLYLVFLLSMSVFLSKMSLGQAQTLAVIVAAASIIAASADWMENYLSIKALTAAFTSAGDGPVSIYVAAYVKWALIFVATSILSVVFWRGGLWNVAAGLLLVSSLAGLVGLTIESLRPPLFKLYFATQLLTLLIVGVSLMFSNVRHSFLQPG